MSKFNSGGKGVKIGGGRDGLKPPSSLPPPSPLPKKLGPQPKPQRLVAPPTLKTAGKVGAPSAALSAPAQVGARPVRPSTPAPMLKPGQQPFRQGVIGNPMRTQAPKIGNKG